jgi:hypothetical protein
LLVEGFSLFWIFLGRSIIRFHRRPNRNVVHTWRFPGIETPERRQVLSHCDAIVGVDVTIWSSVSTLRFDRRCRRYDLIVGVDVTIWSSVSTLRNGIWKRIRAILLETNIGFVKVIL